MKPDKISFILIPPNHKQQKNFKLNYKTFKILFVVLIALLILFIGSWGLLWNQARKYSNYSRKIEEFNDQQAQLQQLTKDFNKLCAFNNYMRQLIGIEFDRSNVNTDEIVGKDNEFALVDMSHVPDYAPASGPVTQGYMSASRKHYGIDIAGNTGDAVMAAADGLVVFAGWTPKLGNMVVISHSADYISIYGHNDRLIVKGRDYVKKGDLIAHLGSTGNSTGPHLHFEIWHRGNAVNPKNYIADYHDK